MKRSTFFYLHVEENKFCNLRVCLEISRVAVFFFQQKYSDFMLKKYDLEGSSQAEIL